MKIQSLNRCIGNDYYTISNTIQYHFCFSDLSGFEHNTRVAIGCINLFFYHIWHLKSDIYLFGVFMCYFWWIWSFILLMASACLYHLACKERHFGTNCSQVCSPNCVSDTCRHTDGWCKCAAGLAGQNCSAGNSLVKYLQFHIFMQATTEMEHLQLIQIISNQFFKTLSKCSLIFTFFFQICLYIFFLE